MTARIESKGSSHIVGTTVADIAQRAKGDQALCQDLNLLPDVEWGVRQKVRTIQGHLSKAEDEINELMWTIGTDDMVDIIREIWPDNFED